MISGYPVTDRNSPQVAGRKTYNPPYLVPRLEEVIEQIRPLPSYTMLLGVCEEDESPLIVELENSSCGPIISISDNRYSNQQFLRSTLESVCRLNTKSEINIHLIAPNAGVYPELISHPHLIQKYTPYDMASWVLVEEFVKLGRERQAGLKAKPLQILVIDEMDLLVQDFEQDLLKQFLWLLEIGPELNMCVIATISSKRILREIKPLLNSFGTKIFGRIESPIESSQIAGRPFLDLSGHVPGVEYTIRTAEEDVKIILPQTGNTTYLHSGENLPSED